MNNIPRFNFYQWYSNICKWRWGQKRVTFRRTDRPWCNPTLYQSA